MTIIESGYSDLLDIAQLVLQSADFEHYPFTTRNDTKVVVAENAYYVLAIAQVAELSTVAAYDEELAGILIDAAKTAGLRAKRWDLYAVLLSEWSAPDEEALTITLSEIRQDTQSVRRIVRSGVEPTLEGVQQALTTFLPFRALSSSIALEDPLSHLQRVLPAHGTSESSAARVIAAFRATSQVNDA